MIGRSRDLGNREDLGAGVNDDIITISTTVRLISQLLPGNTIMASQRIFQLGLRRAAAPGLRVQPAGRMVQRRYVIATPREHEGALLGHSPTPRAKY